MTAVSFDSSMSLDEYIAAPNRRPEEPLGGNRERLHEWACRRAATLLRPDPKAGPSMRELIVDFITSLDGYAHETRQRRTP